MRVVLGVLVGYLLTGLLVSGMLVGMFLFFGTRNAFVPDSWEASPLWCAMSLFVGLIAAVIGGWTCRTIGGSKLSTQAMCALILVFGIFALIATLGTTKSTEIRPENVDMQAAMSKAITPLWAALSNIVIGVAGTLYGGRIVEKHQKRKETLA